MNSKQSNSSKFASPWFWAAILGVAVLTLVIGLASTRSNNQAGGSLKVVAAENFWGDIASQIGGSHVKVTSIITDPEADPHLYESDAKAAAAVASADVVITNGLGYDDFMDKLLGASKNDRRQVLSAQKIMGVTDPGANQHIWYDTSRVSQVAAQIAAGLAAKDPEHKEYYEKNLAEFTASLKPIHDVTSEIKTKYPGAPVAYTEPVAGYLLQNAGLTDRTPEGFAKAIEDATDPSPADAAAMDNLITNRSVKVLLYNSQATSPITEHLQEVAARAGVPVVGVTETLPPDKGHYQDWQLEQAKALLEALGKK